jgi:hypothetical protein
VRLSLNPNTAKNAKTNKKTTFVRRTSVEEHFRQRENGSQDGEG